jgi:hypothetical protein
MKGLENLKKYSHRKHSIIACAAWGFNDRYIGDLLQFCHRPMNEKRDPQEVLFERRPDVQHLPLTCENTNTPLPYIDLVNETLESVTNNLSLAIIRADTGHVAGPEELLANPQFVSDQAP